MVSHRTIRIWYAHRFSYQQCRSPIPFESKDQDHWLPIIYSICCVVSLFQLYRFHLSIRRKSHVHDYLSNTFTPFMVSIYRMDHSCLQSEPRWYYQSYLIVLVLDATGPFKLCGVLNPYDGDSYFGIQPIEPTLLSVHAVST